MYIIVIQHLNSLWDDHHNQFSYHLSPFKVITILLTVFPILYSTSPWLIYNWNFVFLNLFYLFPSSPHSPLSWQSPVWFLYLWIFSVLFVHLFCFLDSIYKWNHMVFVFLWLILLSIIPARSNHVVTNDKIAFFFFFKFIYLFIYLWLCWVLASVRGPSPAAASGGHSPPRCAGPPPSQPLPLRGTGSRCAGPAAAAHGPSRSVARGILPDQGPNPRPLHWQADSQPLRHQGSPAFFFYGWIIFHCACVCVWVCARVCVYNFFIHSSIDGHFSCYHIWIL